MGLIYEKRQLDHIIFEVFLLRFIYFNYYVGVLSAYRSVHHLLAWCPRRPEESIGSPGPGGFRQLWAWWEWGESNQGPRGEQPVLLMLKQLSSPISLKFNSSLPFHVLDFYVTPRWYQFRQGPCSRDFMVTDAGMAVSTSVPLALAISSGFTANVHAWARSLHLFPRHAWLEMQGSPNPWEQPLNNTTTWVDERYTMCCPLGDTSLAASHPPTPITCLFLQSVGSLSFLPSCQLLNHPFALTSLSQAYTQEVQLKTRPKQITSDLLGFTLTPSGQILGTCFVCP